MNATLTHYLCIGCPLGCRLEVEDDGNDIVQVRGHQCKRGENFAKEEHKDPRRMVTTTVAIRGGELPRLPVKTATPIPKNRMQDLANELHKVVVTAPVKLGDVILANPLDIGTDIVAARDIAAI
jgi:CxxC motif-containing protein